MPICCLLDKWCQSPAESSCVCLSQRSDIDNLGTDWSGDDTVWAEWSFGMLPIVSLNDCLRKRIHYMHSYYAW